MRCRLTFQFRCHRWSISKRRRWYSNSRWLSYPLDRVSPAYGATMLKDCISLCFDLPRGTVEAAISNQGRRTLREFISRAAILQSNHGRDSEECFWVGTELRTTLGPRRRRYLETLGPPIWYSAGFSCISVAREFGHDAIGLAETCTEDTPGVDTLRCFDVHMQTLEYDRSGNGVPEGRKGCTVISRGKVSIMITQLYPGAAPILLRKRKWQVSRENLQEEATHCTEMWLRYAFLAPYWRHARLWVEQLRVACIVACSTCSSELSWLKSRIGKVKIKDHLQREHMLNFLLFQSMKANWLLNIPIVSSSQARVCGSK